MPLLLDAMRRRRALLQELRGEAVTSRSTGKTNTRRRATGSRSRGLVILLLLFALGAARAVVAQVNMPDLRQVSGVPLPAQDVPAGTVSVRVVRGSFANNLVNVEVTFMSKQGRKKPTMKGVNPADYYGKSLVIREAN